MQHKTLYLSKLSNAETTKKTLILNEINNQFNSVSKYLDTSGTMIINKKITFNRNIIFKRNGGKGTKQMTIKGNIDLNQSKTPTNPKMSLKQLTTMVSKNYSISIAKRNSIVNQSIFVHRNTKRTQRD